MEIELKLLLEPGEAVRLRQILGEPLKTIVQYNRYFDDRARTLAKHGWGLRVRLELGSGDLHRVTLTLKHEGDASGDFSVRPEYEITLPSAGVEAADAFETARALLPDPGALPGVVPLEVARLENHRAVYELPGASPVVIELDHTVWPDGSSSDELELEVDEGADRHAAERALRSLLEQSQVRWRVGRESKLERLMRMV